jgi:hypothetical protein
VARRLGVDATTVRKNRKQQATYAELPALGNGWKQSHILAAGELLDKLKGKARAVAGEIISEAGVPAKLGIQILENLAGMSAADRKQIVTGYSSKDSETKTLAKTRAAAQPPNPPAHLKAAGSALRSMRTWSKHAKGTPYEKTVLAILAQCEDLKTSMESDFQTWRDEENEKWQESQR